MKQSAGDRHEPWETPSMTDRGMPEAAAAARRLGEALRRLQRGSGRTLRSLERQVLISDSSLSRYFRGSTVPPWATVRDLCRALDADPAEYRALWEAADRGAGAAPPPPAAAVAVAVAVDGDVRDTDLPPAHRWARVWGRAVGAWLGRPWVRLTAAMVTGAVAGALLTLLVTRPTDPTASLSSGKSLSTNKEGHGNGLGTADSVRIFVSRATGLCLDDSLDFGLRSYGCNGMSYQRWTVHPFTDGTRRIRNHATGRCLYADGAGLRAKACDASAPQRWLVTTWSDDSVEVRSRTRRSCLDDDGAAGLRFLPCDRTKPQRWG